MKSDLRAQAVQFFSIHKAKLRAKLTTHSSALWTKLSAPPVRWYQALERRLRSGWMAITQLSHRSILLKSVALGAMALMAVLIISGLQAVSEPPSAPNIQASPAPVQPLPQGWSRLPQLPGLSVATAPAQPPPATQPAAKSEAKPDAKSAAKPAAKPAAKSAAKPVAKSPSPAAASPSAQPLAPPDPSQAIAQLQALNALTPSQESAPAHPSNYGVRQAKDVFGKPVLNQPLIVLHETVGSADSAINMFQAGHSDEAMQVSYHSIIRQDGTIVYIVPAEKRAFGAGNSVFRGSQGAETVKTHKQFPPSVNNFAYHISLATPPGGANENEIHSGYSEAQYRSLAWLIAHTNVPDERITTHRDIDQSQSRIDPRSFDMQRLLSILHSLPRPYVN